MMTRSCCWAYEAGIGLSSRPSRDPNAVYYTLSELNNGGTNRH